MRAILISSLGKSLSIASKMASSILVNSLDESSVDADDNSLFGVAIAVAAPEKTINVVDEIDRMSFRRFTWYFGILGPFLKAYPLPSVPSEE
jgi:hypothetical protein